MARERGRQWFLDQLRSGKPLMGETAEDLVATLFALTEKAGIPQKTTPPAWKTLQGVPEAFPPSEHEHSQYLTEETDPTVPEYVKDITQADIDLWNTPSAPGGIQIAGVTGVELGEISIVEYAPEIGEVREVTILGQDYPAVIAPTGDQWMSANLAFDDNNLPGYVYDNNVANLSALGYMYPASKVAYIRSLMADGWRIPLRSDWHNLLVELGVPDYAGSPVLGCKEPGTTWWNTANGTNTLGFNFRGGGRRQFSGTYQDLKAYGYFVFDDGNNDATHFYSVEYTDAGVFNLYPGASGTQDVSVSIRLMRDREMVILRFISVPAFSVRLFDDSAFLTDAQVFDVPAQEIPVPGYDQRYYLCAQRSGNTVTLVSVPQSDVYTINMSNIVPLWRFEIHGTELHQISYDNMGDGLPNKQEFAQLRTEPYRLAVEGGLSGTITAGRGLSLTSAEVFFGHHRVSVLAFDSDIDLVHDYYHVSSAWDDTEYSGTWEWDNLQYDNGTDLVTLGNNKWGAIFVYRSIGDSKEIFVVRGQTEASHIEGARLIGIPPTPDLIQWHTMLVGRILFQKSATTGTWEPYSTASFLRSLSPQIALDDLTDVTVVGAAEASVLQKNLAGEWVGDLLPWDDMRHITAAKTTGANVPSYAAFGTSMYGWRFAAGDLLSCDSEQMPHSWAGTPIRPHVHFGSDNGGTGNIVWEVIIATRPAKTGTWSAEQTITKTWTGTLAAGGVDALDLWDSPGVTLVDTGASTLMKMRIRMVSKTFTGNVFLDGFDSHIQHKRLGTINEFGPL